MAKCLAALFSWFSPYNCDPQSCRILRQVSVWCRLQQCQLPVSNTDLHSSTQNDRPPEERQVPVTNTDLHSSTQNDRPPEERQVPVTNTDLHSSTQNHRPPELGKAGQLVVQVAFTVISGLIFSQLMLKQVHELIIVGLLLSSTAVCNGLVFRATYPSLGNALLLIGITLIMCLLYVLVGTFLHSGLSYACWVCTPFHLPPPLYYLYYRRFEDIRV